MQIEKSVTLVRKESVDLLKALRRLFPKVNQRLNIHQITFALAKRLYGQEYVDKHSYYFDEKELKELADSLCRLLKPQKDGFRLELVILGDYEGGHDIMFHRVN